MLGWSLMVAVAAAADCFEGGDWGRVCLDGFLVVLVLLAMDCALLKTVVAVGGTGGEEEGDVVAMEEEEGGDCVLVNVPDPAVFAVI